MENGKEFLDFLKSAKEEGLKEINLKISMRIKQELQARHYGGYGFNK